MKDSVFYRSALAPEDLYCHFPHGLVQGIHLETLKWKYKHPGPLNLNSIFFPLHQKFHEHYYRIFKFTLNEVLMSFIKVR